MSADLGAVSDACCTMRRSSSERRTASNASVRRSSAEPSTVSIASLACLDALRRACLRTRAHGEACMRGGGVNGGGVHEGV